MLRVAIVEDDPAYVQCMTAYLDRFRAETQEEIAVSAFPDGVDIVDDYKPVWDIIFLDIEMPHLDGLSTAQWIRKCDDKVVLVFITNMAQYAIRGYEVAALDFVLKPVSYGQFFMKMQRAAAAAHMREDQHVILQSREGSLPVQVNDIVYVEVTNHRLQVVTALGRWSVFDSLNHFEKQLPRQRFSRCSQSFLVNLRHVKRVMGNTVLVGTYELTISRSRKKDFLQAVSDYFGGVH